MTLSASVVIDRSQWGIAWRKMGMTKMDTDISIEARFIRAVTPGHGHASASAFSKKASTSARSSVRFIGGTRASNAPR